MNILSCINSLGFILAAFSVPNVVTAGPSNDTNNIGVESVGGTENKESSIKQRWWTETDYQSNQPPDGNLSLIHI